jgi:hypothetical protein
VKVLRFWIINRVMRTGSPEVIFGKGKNGRLDCGDFLWRESKKSECDGKSHLAEHSRIKISCRLQL